MKVNLKTNFRSKKGQFYLLTAIIFCSVMFMLLYNRQPIPKVNPEFGKLYNNYIYEAPVAINNAIYENKNLSKNFDNFTINFMTFAKERNIDFRVFYVLVYDDKLEVVNYLKHAVNITNNNLLLNSSQKRVLDKLNNLTIEYGGTIYIYNITEEDIQFKVLIIK